MLIWLKLPNDIWKNSLLSIHKKMFIKRPIIVIEKYWGNYIFTTALMNPSSLTRIPWFSNFVLNAPTPPPILQSAAKSSQDFCSLFENDGLRILPPPLFSLSCCRKSPRDCPSKNWAIEASFPTWELGSKKKGLRKFHQIVIQSKQGAF